MLFYFIVFTIIGFLVPIVSKGESDSIITIIVIAIMWGIASGPIWGLAALGEMILGFFLSRIIR